tara:strand:- start:2161 stop:3429 length:1269 start_codon:yes stop_codon:yes gene_type:complete
MSVILQVRDLSKQYRLGEIGTGTISHDLNKFIAKMKGKEDPYLVIGEENRRTIKGGKYVWALKNISFKINHGEVLGIIGSNGAGKSTLLKLLSSITSPSTGEINYNGRIASLLEVGTGFHPELTGKENIFLNGAILGMTKEEIEKKIDEIIEFSGCEKYIDTPVKRYSSGMKVRLGFAVAAHLEPEILIVDEVLAVGDAEFQKKCIEKMQDVSKSGRTILFVSHNLSSIRNLCSRLIVLDKGSCVYDGDVENGINYYINVNNNPKSTTDKIEFVDNGDIARITRIEIETINGNLEFINDFYSAVISFKIRELIPDLILVIILEDIKGNMLFISSTDELENDILRNLKNVGNYNVKCNIPGKILKPGKYFLTFSLRATSGEPFHKVERAISFQIQDTISQRGLKNRYRELPIISPVITFSLNN